MKKLINSFKYAFNGIYLAFKSEQNMKIHYTIMILVIIFGIIYRISYNEWLICLLCFGLVIASEMFNTSIEALADAVDLKKNKQIKKVKDIAAGGVLISALIAAIIGLLIFIPKIF
jgi:diacylglycerol kinase